MEEKDEKAWLISQTEANYRPVSDQLGKACAGCRWFEARNEYGGSACRIVQSYPLEIVATGLSNRYEALPVINEYGGVVLDAPADSQAVVAVEGIRATTVDDELITIKNDGKLSMSSDIPSARLTITQSGESLMPGKSFTLAPTGTYTASAAIGTTHDNGTITWQEVKTPVQPVGNTPNLVERITERVKSALQRGNSDIIAFKVNTVTRSWVGIWSNNFEDREGEIFTAKAIDDYIARVDMGVTPPPELWVWHTPGTKIGQAQHVARVGAFAVAMGTFDNNPLAERGMQTLAKSKSLGMSHGFMYNPAHKAGRIYHQFNTFELSVLPRDKAANSYTSFEEIDVKLEGEKKTFLEGILGTEQTGALEKALEDATASLTERGIASKELFGDFASVSDATAESVESAKEAVETTTKALAPLLIDVLDAQAESANLETKLIGRIKELETQVSGFKAVVDALQLAVDLKPRIASDSKETVDKNATEAEKSLLKGNTVDPFWGTIVEKGR